LRKKPHVAVIGAGAFGGWTALHLLERGARVTLFDAWGAGHPRGTSNDENRILRCGYGTKPLYTEWAWRALKTWHCWQRRWREQLFVPSGVLWFCAEEDEYVRASLAALREQRIPHERLTPREIRRRFPQVNPAGLRFGYFEPRAGFLRARFATMRVAQAVAESGGHVLVASAEPPPGVGASAPTKKQRRAAPASLPQAVAEAAGRSNIARIRLSTGDTLGADYFVFACGPWLPQLFPDLLGRRIRVTRQEVFYFGPPPGDHHFEPPAMPAWIEPSAAFYGVPAFDGRGFKIASDLPGPLFDPTSGERVADPANLKRVCRQLARRFPALARAPLVELRVCQYERTPDSHLVIDRHPDYSNVWLAGGGSGHGFKLGPAVGEFIAEQLLAARPRPMPSEMRLGACAWPAAGPAPITHSF
jgi:glycine/D-amino acid oxidase-like deaminating enzyme